MCDKVYDKIHWITIKKMVSDKIIKRFFFKSKKEFLYPG